MANFKGLTQCTKSQYNALTKDANTLYCLTDAKILYAPAYSASDAGKMLRVKADGTLEWWNEPTYTNLVPLSTENDFTTIYNGGLGYKNGYRLQSALGETEQANSVVCGYIPVVNGDVIRFKGVFWDITNAPSSGGYAYAQISRLSGGTHVRQQNTNQLTTSPAFTVYAYVNGVKYTATRDVTEEYPRPPAVSSVDDIWYEFTVNAAFSNMYVRINGYNTAGGANFVITKNEPIGSRVPDAYQEVEWIDNRVAGNYIDTGYICSSNNLRVKSKVMFTGSSVTTQSLWGSRNGGTCYTIIPYNTDRMYVGSSDDIANFGTRELNTEYVYDLTANNGSFSGTRNDVSISASYNATMDTTYSQYIFGINYNGTGSSEESYYRLYYWQLWDNNVLACDLVPCYRKLDNLIGVYDLVRSTFCQIIGSYPPMKGPDVPPTVVPQTYIGGIPVAIDGGYMLDDYGPLAIDVANSDYFIAVCQGTANKSISWYVGPDKIGGMHQWSSAASRDSGLTSDDYWSESGSRTLPASSIGNLNYFAFNFNKQYASVSYVVDEDGNYLLKGSDVQ